MAGNVKNRRQRIEINILSLLTNMTIFSTLILKICLLKSSDNQQMYLFCRQSYFKVLSHLTILRPTAKHSHCFTVWRSITIKLFRAHSTKSPHREGSKTSQRHGWPTLSHEASRRARERIIERKCFALFSSKVSVLFCNFLICVVFYWFFSTNFWFYLEKVNHKLY